ncbi:MAG: alanine racemase [Asticcacaulis sp.]
MDQLLVQAALDTGAGGILRIDLGALKANYQKLCSLAAPTPVSAVVKADAYGLGVLSVCNVLFDAGCRHFFVALTCEAFELRPELPEEARLYVLNGLTPGSETRAAEAGLIPVLNSPQQLDAWAAVARVRSQTLPAQTLPALLQVDTGMSRLGFMPADLEALAEDKSRLEGLRIDFLMSHLACADEPAHPANLAQLETLEHLETLFPDVNVCFANSGGLFLGAEYHGDLCRPGIALYGGAPHADKANPMQPVIALDLAVIQTRTVPAGTRIGYGGTVTTTAPKRLATLSAGYADGLPRALSNSGAVWFKGTRLPFIGRVSMDSIIIDIDALPEGALKPGDFVELIGPNQTLDELAEAAGTISYEILTSLGPRYHRHYLSPEG